ncbi:MAG: CBS domain-containing protein [Actinomycetota bacterium]|nr:CBS domain-containing protein [Actinomycetota bacterium]
MGQTLKEVMTHDPVSLSASAPVTEAAQAMRDSDIGDVIVLDDGNQICGIVTDRDIAVQVVADNRDAATTKLGEICSREVATLAPESSIGEAVKLMSERAIRRIPVVDGGRPVGIVSLGDLAVTRDPESALADISAAPADQP